MSKHVLQVGSVGIKTNSDGMVPLTDIYQAAVSAGMAEGKVNPKDWQRREGKELVEFASSSLNGTDRPIIKSARGKGGGTYGEANIALAYAKYLSPELHYQVNETYLRAKSGDVTLADEIVDKAKPEDQVLHLMRTAGKVQRKQFTGSLVKHEVDGKGIGVCTNAIYTGAFNACASELRKIKNLPEKANVREHMTVQEIIQTAHAEMIAVRNMDATRARGTRECARVCEDAARKVASI